MHLETKYFRIAVLVAISWTIVMKLFSPPNMVQFELARSTIVATEIISNWGPEGIAKAKTSTYLDFLYIIFYSAAIALGCSVASRYSKNNILIKLGTGLSIFTLVAGVCDVIENIVMLRSLHAMSETTVSVAYNFALVKFVILFIALLFILTAFATGVLRKND